MIKRANGVHKVRKARSDVSYAPRTRGHKPEELHSLEYPYLLALFLQGVGIDSSRLQLETVSHFVNRSVRQLQELRVLMDEGDGDKFYHDVK